MGRGGDIPQVYPYNYRQAFRKSGFQGRNSV